MPGHSAAEDIAKYLTKGYFNDRGSVIPFNGDIVGKAIEVDIGGLSADGKQLAKWAMNAWEGVADIQFKIVTPGSATAELKITNGGSTPRVQWQVTDTGEITSADMTVPRSYIDRHGTAIDQYAFQTYMHELGHALGLGHAGNYDGGADFHRDATFAKDSWQLSVMSYFGQNENPNVDGTRAGTVTPMLADIIAAQELYGAPKAHFSEGNTVWGIGSNIDGYLGEMFKAMKTDNKSVFANYAFTMYLNDVGGVDTIDFSHDNRGQTVDLTPGAMSNVLGQIDNLILADGTLIENYNSGGGQDRIKGNAANNRIDSGANDDKVFGLGGADEIRADIGDDQVYGGGGADRLFGDYGHDLLNGGKGNDKLVGGVGDDKLYGEAGHDILWGEGGADVISGKAGEDEIVGGDGDDDLRGGSDADEITGDGGSDRILGQNGSDRLSGGDGSDVIDGGRGRDGIDGGAGADTLYGGGGGDNISGGDVSDRLEGGAGRDKLYGDGAGDVLFGGAGKDWLYGGESGDTLTGGAGADKFVFDGGTDYITDFKDNIDTIVLDSALWLRETVDVRALLDNVKELDGEMMLKFPSGDRLVIEGLNDAQRLFNDIDIL